MQQPAVQVSCDGNANTSTVFGGINVNNTNWDVSYAGSYVYLTLKQGFIFNANSTHVLGLNVKMNNQAPGNQGFNLTGVIKNQ
jgi:hypothetical protein